MKKRKYNYFLALIVLLLFPIRVLAYSDYIIPGGENIGIEINSDGIMIIGFYKVNGKLNKGSPSLKVGDLILKVNNQNVGSIQELVETINEKIVDSQVRLTYKSGNNIKETTLNLELIDGVYKTGLYVKDSLTGIGTLTYIDPETKIYGALGHEIIESTTKNRIEVKTGSIFKSSITTIDRSSDGSPGGKNAKFYYQTKYGTVNKNTGYGIYGTYDSYLPKNELLKVGSPDDVKTGKATIYTVLNGEKVEEFEITIDKIVKDGTIKNIHFKITDENLLLKTGGVVQGMSGSPIIQNNMIIGAVTHVVVDSVQNGYGLFITTMLEEGEN